MITMKWSLWSDSHRRIRVYKTRPVAADGTEANLRPRQESPPATSTFARWRSSLTEGEVEVFRATGHAKAKRAYAWSHREGPGDEGERFVAVLELPPVDSARRAVQVQIVRDPRPGSVLI